MWKRHAMEDLESSKLSGRNPETCTSSTQIPRARRAKLRISLESNTEMKRKRAKVKPRLSCRFKMILGCL